MVLQGYEHLLEMSQSLTLILSCLNHLQKLTISEIHHPDFMVPGNKKYHVLSLNIVFNDPVKFY